MKTLKAFLKRLYYFGTVFADEVPAQSFNQGGYTCDGLQVIYRGFDIPT